MPNAEPTAEAVRDVIEEFGAVRDTDGTVLGYATNGNPHRMAAEILKLRAQFAEVREALAGLVGVTDPEELRQMHAILAAVPHPDQAAMVNAVRVILSLDGAA